MDKRDIFVPVENKLLTQSYPELEKVDAFKGLKSLDAKFAWYYAVFFSDEKNKQDRIKKALNASYKQYLKEEDNERFLRGDFPDKIREAIQWFERMDTPARVTAKFTCERILDSYMKLVDVDIDTVGLVKIYDQSMTKEVGEKRDWNQVSAFVNATAKINEYLPELIKTLEHGFGISKKVKKRDGGESLRDDFIQQLDEQGLKSN